MRWCVSVVVTWLMMVGLGSLASAQTEDRSLAPGAARVDGDSELRVRLRLLQQSAQLDDSVRRPVELAKSALERASSRGALGDTSGELRARQIAAAALELAEARLTLLRERALWKAARARRLEAERADQTAERALARERQRAKELEQASTPP
jgi:hypothetical protein